MYFTTLRYTYDSNAEKQLERIENKQRITLSDHAVSTLLMDLDVFNNSDREYLTAKDIPSADVNRIFRAFCSDAESSVHRRLSDEATKLKERLRGICPPELLQKMVSTLLEKRRDGLVESVQNRISKKGIEYYFRINQKNQNYLASDQAQEEAEIYEDNIGHYFKAVLEEYCSLPYTLREQYYFQDLIHSIHAAKAERRLLKIKLHSLNRRTQKHNILYMKPYDVRQDSGGMYNYLVAMMSDSPGGPWAIGSIRLTSIMELDDQGKDVVITQNKQEAIEEAIRTKGAQFLSDDNGQERIVVQFTPRGEKMYKSMLHLRPQYRKKKSDRIYEFECPAYQARNYFFKFGKDVTILEPASLVSQFKWEYQKALDNYPA